MSTYNFGPLVPGGLVVEVTPVKLPVGHPEYFSAQPQVRCTLNGEDITRERAQELLDEATGPERRFIVA